MNPAMRGRALQEAAAEMSRGALPSRPPPEQSGEEEEMAGDLCTCPKCGYEGAEEEFKAAGG